MLPLDSSRPVLHLTSEDTLHKHPKKAPLHVWHLRDTTVSLYWRPNQRLKAVVVKKGEPRKAEKIDQIWIQGIPNQVRTSPVVLERFLQDTYVQLRLLSDNQSKIAILPRLRGGVEPETSIRRRLSPEVLGYVRQAIEEAKKSEGHPLVALVGNTGVGKSTIINDLSGVELKYELSIPGDLSTLRVVPKEGQTEIAKMGHDFTQSETLYTTIYSIPSRPFKVADCGGFLDTRDTGAKLAVPLSIMYTLQNATNVRLAICFDHNELLSSRGQRFGELIYTVLGALVRNDQIEEALKSVIFLFTKAKTTFNGGMLFTPDARSIATTLERFAEELSTADPHLAELYRQIAREQGRFIHVYDPTKQESRAVCLQLLDQVTPIQQPKTTFGVPYSKESEAGLLNDIGAIAAEAKALYQTHKTLLEKKEQNKKEQETNKQEQTNAKQLIDLKGTANLKQFQDAVEAQKTAYKNKIAAEEKTIKDNQDKIKQEEGLLAASKTVLNNLDREGEEIKEDYWTDGIDTGAQHDAIDVTTRHKGRRRFFLFGKRKPFSTTTVEKAGRDITHTFRYIGPSIATIAYDPEENDACWSTRQGESVVDKERGILTKVYKSGEGNPAKASIKISVKKKDLPENLQTRLSTLNDIQSRSDTISQLATASQWAQNAITQAKLELTSLEVDSLRQDLYQEKTARLQQQQKQLEEERRKLEEDIKAAAQSMHALKGDIVFLRDFLGLCGDDHLNQQFFIKDFLALYPKYSQVIDSAQTN